MTRKITTHLLLIVTLPSVTLSVVKILDPECERELGEPGWRCGGGGDCIFLDWICDNIEQCDDDSDESEAMCNLYPESGCQSFYGREHFKCKRTGQCLDTKEEADQCEEETDEVQPPPDTPDTNPTGDGGDPLEWQCANGFRILLQQVRRY